MRSPRALSVGFSSEWVHACFAISFSAARFRSTAAPIPASGSVPPRSTAGSIGPAPRRTAWSGPRRWPRTGIGEQTATCSPAQPCRFSWPLESDNQFKAVTLIVKKSQPGYLQAIAMHGLASPSVRLPDKSGASATLNAVRSSPNAADVVLMKLEIERR